MNVLVYKFQEKAKRLFSRRMATPHAGHGALPIATITTQRAACCGWGKRCILNEAEILPMLEEHGFETRDLGKFSTDEQIALCGQASVILGLHGANLTNMLWCAPGTTLVELFGRGFRPTFQRHMAYNLDLQYRYWAEQPMVPSDLANSNWDLICDASPLRKYLGAQF